MAREKGFNKLDTEVAIMAAQRRQNRNARSTNPNCRRKAAANWLRIPMTVPKGCPLRVVIYARYGRKPSVPATEHEPARGPFFDEIDPRWAPVVHEAYVRVAADELLASVGRWLTLVGLPKTANAWYNEWNEKT